MRKEDVRAGASSSCASRQTSGGAATRPSGSPRGRGAGPAGRVKRFVRKSRAFSTLEFGPQDFKVRVSLDEKLRDPIEPGHVLQIGHHCVLPCGRGPYRELAEQPRLPVARITDDERTCLFEDSGEVDTLGEEAPGRCVGQRLEHHELRFDILHVRSHLAHRRRHDTRRARHGRARGGRVLANARRSHACCGPLKRRSVVRPALVAPAPEGTPACRSGSLSP